MTPATLVFFVLASLAQVGPGGAVTVSTDAANCALSASVQVWATALVAPSRGPAAAGPSEHVTLYTELAANGGPLSSYVTFVTGERVAAGTCTWTFRDLPPGGYLALLTGETGSRDDLSNEHRRAHSGTNSR